MYIDIMKYYINDILHNEPTILTPPLLMKFLYHPCNWAIVYMCVRGSHFTLFRQLLYRIFELYQIRNEKSTIWQFANIHTCTTYIPTQFTLLSIGGDGVSIIVLSNYKHKTSWIISIHSNQLWIRKQTAYLHTFFTFHHHLVKWANFVSTSVLTWPSI